MPINDPTQEEFYPRRLYTHRAPRTEADTQGDFCITNSAAAPAYRDWDPASGVDGLVGQIREWHQPRGAGSDAQITEIAERMIDMALGHGYLEARDGGYAKVAPSPAAFEIG